MLNFFLEGTEAKRANDARSRMIRVSLKGGSFLLKILSSLAEFRFRYCTFSGLLYVVLASSAYPNEAMMAFMNEILLRFATDVGAEDIANAKCYQFSEAYVSDISFLMGSTQKYDVQIIE